MFQEPTEVPFNIRWCVLTNSRRDEFLTTPPIQVRTSFADATEAKVGGKAERNDELANRVSLVGVKNNEGKSPITRK